MTPIFPVSLISNLIAKDLVGDIIEAKKKDYQKNSLHLFSIKMMNEKVTRPQLRCRKWSVFPFS